MKPIKISSISISDFCLFAFVIFISLFAFVYYFSCYVYIKTYGTFLRCIIALTFLRSVNVTLRYCYIPLRLHNWGLMFGAFKDDLQTNWYNILGIWILRIHFQHHRIYILHSSQSSFFTSVLLFCTAWIFWIHSSII